ncbi:PIN domain-containing protein [Thermococcus sp. ES12]|nr:PIN domain-containing protein [Thermococcus sp. ES12]
MIFLDSSVLIEGLKGNPSAVALFEEILRQELIPVINDIVFSEFLFHYIALKTGVSPFTVKKRREIDEVLSPSEPKDFLEQFHVLPADDDVLELAYGMMVKHNLLPNDAIILATCLTFGIKLLGTLDSDLREAGMAEGLEVLP